MCHFSIFLLNLQLCRHPAVTCVLPRHEKTMSGSHDSQRGREKAADKYSGPDRCLLTKETPCSCSVSFTPSHIQQIRAGGVSSPKCCNLFLREQKCVPPPLPSGNRSGIFCFVSYLFFFGFIFPLCGVSLYEGGQFCLTPAMFAAGNESY